MSILPSKTLTILFGLLILPRAALAVNFSDVPTNAWFATPIQAVAEGGIMQGYRDTAGNLTGKFGPADAVTRAQFLKMVAVMMVDRYTFDRTTVVGGEFWFRTYRDIVSARDPELNQILPLSDAELSLPIQRHEAAGLLLLALGNYQSPMVVEGYPTFSDVLIGTPHSHAIAELEFRGVISGDSDTGKFNPYRTLNRAEAAKMLVQTANAYQKPLGLRNDHTASSYESSRTATDEQSCLDQGGTWKRGGLFPQPFCNFPHADGGKACTDNDECKGDCISSNRDATSGTCTAWVTYFGCFGTLENGTVGRILCRD